MHVGERAARPGRPLPVADPPAAAPAENAGSAVMAAALTDSPLPPARMSGPDLASSAPVPGATDPPGRGVPGWRPAELSRIVPDER